ncbi:MAG: response regulator [Verrucomicrobia bacterium]|nr:response regulator [Verrucomicrobiota bacterium]
MNPKILIVDDEPLNLTTLEAFLSGDGYELHFAENGRDACALAQVIQPDLILLDVMMPEMDGFAVCRYLRADPVLGRVPIIVVTALDDDASRLEGLRAGADDFLTKPCRREEIRARVRTVASLNRFRAIAEQSERFQRLYELAPVAIVLADERGGVVAANRLAETTLAMPEGRPLAGTTLGDRFSPAGAVIVNEAIAAALRGTVVASRDLRRGEGEAEIALQVRATVLRESGTSLAMLIFDNVTEEVRARTALQKLNSELDATVRARTRQLEEANALLMSYASFVSHDLRSPLTVMKGYLSLIHEGVIPVNAEAVPIVDQAFQATVVMQELIQNILQLAQDVHDGPREERVSVNPGPVISRLFLHLSGLYPSPTRRFTLGVLPPVGVSAVVIERIFYNLLGNALKFSAERPEPLIEVGTQDSADGPVLFVRDNGVGFDSRQSDRLFREFSRLDTAGKSDGFGLGLSLVARLLRAQGGRIWAEGSVGAGATFYVQLPAPMTAAA